MQAIFCHPFMIGYSSLRSYIFQNQLIDSFNSTAYTFLVALSNTIFNKFHLQCLKLLMSLSELIIATALGQSLSSMIGGSQILSAS